MEIEQKTLESLEGAINSIGAADFWVSLHEFLVNLMPHEMGGVFVYIRNGPPIRLFDSEQNPERDRVHQILAKVGYLISPYYNGLIKTGAEDAFYHINDVAPDEFRDSEYFRVYYGHKCVSDEGMFLSRIDDATFVIMVERRTRRPQISDAELECLRSIAGLVSALINRHVRLLGVGEMISPEDRNRQVGFQHIAERFGTDFLSKREREVALLILRGHSTKSAARKLGISPETERVHRRRLYSRLDISSHSELFWLFLEATEHFDPVRKNDPLVDYLKIEKPYVFDKDRNDL